MLKVPKKIQVSTCVFYILLASYSFGDSNVNQNVIRDSIKILERSIASHKDSIRAIRKRLDSLEDTDISKRKHTFPVEEINRPLLYSRGNFYLNPHRNAQIDISTDWIGIGFWHSSAIFENFFYSITDRVSIGLAHLPYLKIFVIGNNQHSGRCMSAGKIQVAIGGGVYWVHVNDRYYWDKDFFIEHMYNIDCKLLLSDRNWFSSTILANLFNENIADIQAIISINRQLMRNISLSIHVGWWQQHFFYSQENIHQFQGGLGCKTNFGKHFGFDLNAMPTYTLRRNYITIDIRGGFHFVW